MAKQTKTKAQRKQEVGSMWKDGAFYKLRLSAGRNGISKGRSSQLLDAMATHFGVKVNDLDA